MRPICGNLEDCGNKGNGDCYGINLAYGNADPMDDMIGSHGTHAAGIIGAVGNNALGVVGVNWQIASSKRFPPQDHASDDEPLHLQFSIVIDAENPPIRPERHVRNSIATVRIALAVALAQRLPQCPCCKRLLNGGRNPPDY